MKIKDEYVKKICLRIFEEMEKRKDVIVKAEKDKIVNRMVKAFQDEAKKEEDLVNDARRILDENLKKFDGEIDRAKMFKMIKQQLAKERKIIL